MSHLEESDIINRISMNKNLKLKAIIKIDILLLLTKYIINMF